MLFALVPAPPAMAQVYEVNESGSFETHDKPAIFTIGSVQAIEQPRSDNPEARSAANVSDASPVWPQIDAEARRHGLPPALLRAVAWQESRGRAGAVSSKGALGVMQLMPATAAFLGVDPLDEKDNLRGGAMFLRQQLDRFGSVPLALAAYNAGPEAVKRFGGIPPYRETRLYVASILARLPPETAQAPLLNSAGGALR
ncbi:lytic transglycosylase domain-containing protein [Sandarakinorhabdus limnophila]|uniref:lytic transglycosylase domain-containing protein n=1 Tax=Sandarakinorhabdus limnophila TaxID=210512 RepID=UPI00313788DE